MNYSVLLKYYKGHASWTLIWCHLKMNGYVYLHVLWKPIKDLFRVMHQLSTLCNLVTKFVQFYWSSDLSQLTKYDIYNIMKVTCTHFLSSKLCIDWNNSLIWCTETLIRSKFLILILHFFIDYLEKFFRGGEKKK